MPLNELTKFPNLVSVIPGSGIQFLDFGFSLPKDAPVPRDWGFFEERTAALNDDTMPVLVRRGDEETNRQERYSINVQQVVQMMDRNWMPIPLFREEMGGGYFRGPTNWARGCLVALDEPDADGNAYRLVLALDTNLADFFEEEAYLAPSPEDARNGRSFSLPSRRDPLDWFLREPWFKDWCLEAFKEMVERDERRRAGSRHVQPLSSEELLERMEGPHEHIARYKAFIDLLHALDILPKLKVVDRSTEPRPAPVDVDMVIDLGNSRTCGLLIETEPDQLGADITKAVKLQLRDLSRPEYVYSDPFESRLEFSRASFGREHLSLRSGRPDAFSWPTVVRVGPEATRLASLRRGSEGSTGLSGPKRYLWDEDAREDSWRFNAADVHGEQAPVATGVAFTTLINDYGEAIHGIDMAMEGADMRLLPSIRALYSRRNLMSFVLAEVFLQALCMMNSPSHRLRRRNADLPRRLRRIIMTMPTAMTLAERQILQQQAEAARDLAYLSLGLADIDFDENGAQKPVPKPDMRLPEVILKWDEASATQAVYLYGQVALQYSGDARAFFDVMRHPGNATDPQTRDSLRVATLDVGGGTTDLVITSFRAEGQGANVTLFPKQEFREGFNLAGDDALFQVVRELVLKPIRQALADAGLGDERAESVLDRLLGADHGEMHVSDQLRRQQFAAQVAAPIALGMLAHYETYDLTAPRDAELRPFASFFTADSKPNDAVVAYINQEAARQGARGFDLQQVIFLVDDAETDRVVRSVFQEMLRALSEVVWRYRADVLLLAGRPSRLPAVRDILVEAGALPPHRVVPLHRFRVGQWYPFRGQNATIGDPKTTASVGAMICLLGEGQLQNFNFRSDALRLGSTAQFFGKLDRNNRLLEADVYYRDMRLDAEDYDLPDAPFQFRGPMPLGFRQFPVDWWPATRMYSLDYANNEVAAELNARTPLNVTLRRRARDVKKQVVDSFEPASIIDALGRTVPKNKLRLRLQSIDDQQGYWLDTGILLDK